MRRLETYKENIKRLEDDFDHYYNATRRLNTRVQELEGALEFYADEKTYTGEINSVDEGIVIPIDIDRGKRATEALKEK